MFTINCKKREIAPFWAVFSVLIGLAAVFSTAAFLLIRLVMIRADRNKWRDYDDCGVV